MIDYVQRDAAIAGIMKQLEYEWMNDPIVACFISSLRADPYLSVTSCLTGCIRELANRNRKLQDALNKALERTKTPLILDEQPPT